jgi:SAM-dependent methyltransferase
MVGNADGKRIESRRNDRRYPRGHGEDQRERAGCERFQERGCERIRSTGEAGELFGIGEVHDERIVCRSALGGEDVRDSASVRRVGTQPIDSFSWKDHEPAVAQPAGCTPDREEAALHRGGEWYYTRALMGTGRLIRGGRLRLDHLERLSRRPKLYSGRDASFWQDPYVSGHVLQAHLDPHTDDATRRPERIAATVAKILEHVNRGDTGPLPEEPRMLDLGCGPGLYAEQFAARGYAVTGIDFAESSIAYARKQAAAEGQTIDYRAEDILTADLGGPYDLVTIIYGEFCTFAPEEQRDLLRRVRASLAPGGLLVFDVFTEHYARRHRKHSDWYVSTKDGFWQEKPHMVLEQNFFYAQHSASVACYLIVDGSGAFRSFNVWWRHFTLEEIQSLLADEGFSVEAAYGSLWGDRFEPDGEWIGLYCRAAT